ncbi:unnamed protein product [Lymnaea stagnalis]|uniref:WAP domain-containing protein n=1 Tax=Lymnaea stagnalis TaxID=6523 RepID=A0AAV2H029_LYMST
MGLLRGFILSSVCLNLLTHVDEAVCCSLENMCALDPCTPPTFCRIIQKCTDGSCPPQASCLDCLPKGIDDVCNRNRYIYAVLVWGTNDKFPTTRSCDPSLPSVEPNCPEGSVCVPGARGRGTCCYGKPEPGDETALGNQPTCPVKNPTCRPKCKRGYSCQEIIVQCYVPPCENVFECLPEEKPGNCPMLPLYVPDDCPRNERNSCSIDADCYYNYKCCSDQCGIRGCQIPFSK